jgi:hypothetical protein
VKLRIPINRERKRGFVNYKEEAETAKDELIVLLNERLRKMKLRVPHRPKDENERDMNPEMPADITSLNDEQLGKLHGEFAALASYVYGQLGLRSVEHAISKRADRLTRAKVRLEKDGTVEDKAAKTEVDKRTQAVSELLLVAEGTEVLTKAIHDGYLVGRDLCSREMTRRMNTNQNQR